VGHKLQLLDLVTFLEKEHHNEELGALSRGGMKGKKEVKNLESSVNNDARCSCLTCGKRKVMGHPILLIQSSSVRVLNKKSKCLRISNLLKDWKVDIICIQQTKVRGLSRCAQLLGLQSCGLVLLGL